jgi:hypothetical protein
MFAEPSSLGNKSSPVFDTTRGQFEPSWRRTDPDAFKAADSRRLALEKPAYVPKVS